MAKVKIFAPPPLLGRTGHGHSSDVVARDLDLVLHIVGAHVCDAVSQLGRRHP